MLKADKDGRAVNFLDARYVAPPWRYVSRRTPKPGGQMLKRFRRLRGFLEAHNLPEAWCAAFRAAGERLAEAQDRLILAAIEEPPS